MNHHATLGVGANAVLVVHVLFAGFVVVGLLLIIAGGLRRWSWVRNPWFRSAHLAAIGVVIVESWLGLACPLTIWELDLRERAGEAAYGGGCFAYWLQRLLYVDAPPWVFVVAYTLFGLAVVAAWVLVRPRRFRSARRDSGPCVP